MPLLFLVSLPVALGESNVAYGQDDAALVLSAASIEVPEDGEATYTVTLATQPTGAVLVTFSGVTSTDPSPDPRYLIFTASTWNTAQTVTLTAPHDDNGVNEEVTLTHTASGSDYNGVSKDLPITVTDIDEPDLVLSAASLEVLEDGEATYTVKLVIEPTGTVFVTVGGTTGTDLSLDETTLTFTIETWNTAQEVTVSAADDDDGTNDQETLTHTASGGGYGAVSKDLPVAVIDNDTPGLVLSASALEVPEDGAKAYTVKLVTQPTDDVTVTLGGTSGTDLSLDKTSLTFTASTWNTAQTVTVSAADDDDVTNDQETLTHTASGGGYGAVSKDLPVEVIDNDTPGLVLSAASLEVPENGEASYTVKLATLPTGAVTVTLGGTTGTDLSLDKTSLTFNAMTWNTAQTVTVSAADDDDSTNDQATLTHTASGGGYGAVSKDLPVEVIDNDTPGLVLSAASLEVPENGEASYTVKLTTLPTGAVTVTLGGTSGTDLSLDKTSLTFSTTTWNTAQTVRVSAAADDDGENDTATLTHTASGGGYGAVSKDLAVTVIDSDDLALVLSAASIEVPEEGEKEYTVTLATQPTGTVTVTLGGTTGTDLSLDKTSLTFTASTWNTAQTVTVSAAAADDSTNDQATLTHTASGGGYGAMSKDLPVTVIDNDTPGLMLSAASLEVPEDGEASYTVRLATQPTGTVTVTLGGTTGTDLSLDKTSLTFSTTTWITAQTVTVSSADDDDGSNDEATLTHTASGGGYGAVSKDLPVEVIDNDEAALVLSAAAIDVPEEGEKAYTVKLATQPTGTVTVTLGGTSGTDLSLDKTSLTFTASTWNTAQTVTVSAAAADDSANDQATLTHTASGGGYGAVSKDLPVEVIDNDTPGLVLSAASQEVPEDGVATYTVRLATLPTGPVTVTLGGTTGTDLTLDKTSLTFTASTWNTAQTVTVSADAAADATNDEATLTHTASGGGYGAMSKDLPVTVIDDDAPELLVSASTLEVPEGGDGHYTVRLATQPTDTVTVDVSCPENETDILLEMELLVFDTSNWDTPQEVRFSAQQDNDEADETTTVMHAAADGGYDGVSRLITVRINDDDTAQRPNPPKAWLARFGRTVAEQVLEAVEDRISTPRLPGFDGSLAGQGLYAVPHDEAISAGLHGTPDGGSQGLRGRDIAAGTALTLTGGTAEGGFAALWTRGVVTRFGGREGTLSLDGEVMTGLAGVDYAHGAWTAGLVSSLSHGEGTYRAPEGSGEVETSFAGLYPWASHKVTERLTLWGVAG